MKEKVVKTVSLSLWKARAGRFVESMLTDDNTLFDVNENEFDVAIEKKNGVELAEKLRSLATMYASTEKGAPLFWSCDASGKPVKFKTDVVTRIVERLDIRCRDTTPVNHVLAESIKQALEWKFYSVRLVSDDVGGQFLSKKLIHESDFRLGTESKVSKKGKGVHRRHKQIVLCMSAILAAYNSPEDFYGARYPLVAIKDTDNKFLIVFFTHLNHTESSFRIPVEQEGLLREVESWAMSQNLVENPNNYLFPHLDLAGHKSWRWDSKYLLPSLRTILQPLGIGSGQFYLDITTRRFRALTAKFSYTDDDLGYEGSLVLDNDIATFDCSYANGDPEENQMMLSEALEIAARIFKGETIEEAKKAVLASLKKETLTFDEFKLSGLHINQNGTACNGKPDIDTKNTKETDHHRSAARRAEKLGVGDADKIPCFQEDQCAFCKSAKMVDDVNQVYKMLSFIRLLEDRADLRPDDAESLLEKAAYMRLLIDANISDKTASEAEKMLFNQGIHPLVKTMEIAQLIV
ncbi:hypothetical protein Q8W15_24165 [Photobacterium damselae subsp. piscicida]|nr:hypothetical protein [Photobacterium damselae subsp. piscicida]MDP2567932.1 hypothetical protein [Photobacterium damselae subsp. piscicida]